MKYLFNSGSFSISEPLNIGKSENVLAIRFNCGCGSITTSYISIGDFLRVAKSIEDTLSQVKSDTIHSTRWDSSPSSTSYNPYNLKCSKCGCCNASIKETNSRQPNTSQDKAIEILKDADEETCNHLKRIILEYEENKKKGPTHYNLSLKRWIYLKNHEEVNNCPCCGELDGHKKLFALGIFDSYPRCGRKL